MIINLVAAATYERKDARVLVELKQSEMKVEDEVCRECRFIKDFISLRLITFRFTVDRQAHSVFLQPK